MNILVLGGGITGQIAGLLLPEAQVYTDSRLVTRRLFGTNYLWAPIEEVPCRSFPVVTKIDHASPTYERAKAYKEKIGKFDDLVSWKEQFKPLSIAWEFLSPLPTRLVVGQTATRLDPLRRQLTFRDRHAYETTVSYDMLLSTIPLPALLETLSPSVEWSLRSRTIYVTVKPTLASRVDGVPDFPVHASDPYATTGMYVNYVADPTVDIYRWCWRANAVHEESLTPSPGAKITLWPGKIWPSAEAEDWVNRLESFDIYCFGRWASWRPDELTHNAYRRLKDWRNRNGLAPRPSVD